MEGRTVRTEGNTYQEVWRWPRELEEWFHRQLSNIVDPPERPVVHVCCGESSLGDLRIDVVDGLGNVRADMFSLPFGDESVGTVVCDPPYELALQDRHRHMTELARVHRPGGLLLYKASWWPLEGRWVHEENWTWSPRVGLPRDAHLLCRARRREEKEVES